MPIALPDSGTANSADTALTVTQEGSGDALYALAGTGIGLVASSEGELAAHAKSGHEQGIGLLGDAAIGVGGRGSFAGVMATGKIGVYGLSEQGVGVGGVSTGGTAMKAMAIGGVGLHARSHAGVGVFAESELENAVLGEAGADKKAGVFGYNAAFGGIGAVGLAPAKGGVGVVADGDAAGVQASGGENAIVAEASRGTAVIAVAHQSDGVVGSTSSASHSGVVGLATAGTKDGETGAGVHGQSNTGTGVRAVSDSGAAFAGLSNDGPAAILRSGSQEAPAVTVQATAGASGLAVTAAGRGGLAIVNEARFNLLTGDAARINTPANMSAGIHVGPFAIDDVGLSVECPDDAPGISCMLRDVAVFGGDVTVLNGNVSAIAGTIQAATPSSEDYAITGMADFGGYSSDGNAATGVYGSASYLEGTARAVLGMTASPHAPNQYAGVFFGNVRVLGSIWKNEDSFEIDHPLRPAEQFLRHVAVESDERRTIYDGEVTLDRGGAATVEMPRWFASLNAKPRYQLTAIGRPAPELHVVDDDTRRGSFRIAGGAPGQRVCWQVTAVRADAWAKAHPFRVEVDKDRVTRGRYLNPVELGAPEQLGMLWPELEAMRKREAEHGKPPAGAGGPPGSRPTPDEAPTRLARPERPSRPATSDLPEPPDLDRR